MSSRRSPPPAPSPRRAPAAERHGSGHFAPSVVGPDRRGSATIHYLPAPTPIALPTLRRATPPPEQTRASVPPADRRTTTRWSLDRVVDTRSGSGPELRHRTGRNPASAAVALRSVSDVLGIDTARLPACLHRRGRRLVHGAARRSRRRACRTGSCRGGGAVGAVHRVAVGSADGRRLVARRGLCARVGSTSATCASASRSGCARRIGSFRPEFQGQGYAFEAADALVAWLFDTVAPTRIWGMLHPDNHPSAVLLERLGMRFEGHTKSSFWLGDDNSDDLIYGMTRADWESWRTRPVTPRQRQVVPVAPDNAAALRRLVTHKSQERFVAPMLSFAGRCTRARSEVRRRAGVAPVLADGEPVGFIVLGCRARPGRSVPVALPRRRHQQRHRPAGATDLPRPTAGRQDERGGVSWVPGQAARNGSTSAGATSSPAGRRRRSRRPQTL